MGVLLAAALVALPAGCANPPGEDVPPPAVDLGAIRAADRAYASAWLANDPERVLATLTTDAVMIPSGLPALEGEAAIREFWFPPDAPPTVVTELTLDQQEVGGEGEVGWVRGAFTLGFDYDGASYTSHGTYLALFRRIPDGSWRMSHRMWNDQARP